VNSFWANRDFRSVFTRSLSVLASHAPARPETPFLLWRFPLPARNMLLVAWAAPAEKIDVVAAPAPSEREDVLDRAALF
jgi:hypothetical protein